MKLLVNCSNLNSTGPLQVALSFINECRKFKHDYYVVCGSGLGELIDKEKFPANFRFYFMEGRIISSFRNYLRTKSILKFIESQIVPDAVFTVFGPSYWKPSARHIQGFATPQVLYPESPFFSLISIRQVLWWKLHRLANLILLRRESKEIILETFEMERRLKAVMPQCRTYVVPNTYSEFYKTIDLPNNRQIAEDGYFKLLTLCSYKRHKNLEIIPLVIDVLQKYAPPKIKFYLTLPENKYLELIGPEYRQHVINLGPLHPKECPEVYTKVDAMFLPTLLESFSASYAEAMIMGKPILTSHYDFAHTVCGDAAIYFDPLNPSSVAKAILMLIDDPSYYNVLVYKGKERLEYFGDASTRARRYLDIALKNV